MSAIECRDPIPFDRLVEYWLDELAEAEAERIEEHFVLCGSCSRQLGELAALAEGIRAVFRNGDVGVIVTGEFIDRLAEQGLRVRQYRLRQSESVACSVAPEDELVVGRLAAALGGIGRLDAEFRHAPEEPGHRLCDVPFDPRSGEVVVVPNLRRLRSMPPHRQLVRLIAVESDAERVLGDYVFLHGGSG